MAGLIHTTDPNKHMMIGSQFERYGNLLCIWWCDCVLEMKTSFLLGMSGWAIIKFVWGTHSQSRWQCQKRHGHERTLTKASARCLYCSLCPIRKFLVLTLKKLVNHAHTHTHAPMTMFLASYVVQSKSPSHTKWVSVIKCPATSWHARKRYYQKSILRMAGHAKN